MLLAGVPAVAADLEPSPVRAPAPMPGIATVYSWTGLYLGVHGGGGWSKWNGMDPTDRASGWSAANGSGAVAGGQVGGNYQIGSVVLGLEGTYAWSDIKVDAGGPFAGGAGFTLTVKNDYVATIAGRLGYAFDRVLVYGKGGAAFTRDKYSASNGLAGRTRRHGEWRLRPYRLGGRGRGRHRMGVPVKLVGKGRIQLHAVRPAQRSGDDGG